ncbi:phage tail protein [Pseudomonas fulva]
MTAAKHKPRGLPAPVRPQVAGHKGGQKQEKKPVVATNDVGSIATTQLVYIWSWGPIVGPVDGLRSVKLAGTPLIAEDGTVNYPGVKWQFRSGELHQERLTGLTEASNEIKVGLELRTGSPYLRSINNAMLDAVRVRLSWPQLTHQDSSGNISGVRIEYAIDIATDGGPYQVAVASEVDRKNITKYERDHRIELPEGSRWTIRVRRITPEAGSEFTQDTMVVEAIAEIVDSDQEYPLTAVSCLEYDARTFGGDIAKIAVLMRGRIVQVPANYNPATRTYATAGPGTSGGIWDGTFKEAYTNNPAWVLYDLVLNPYYGLGERINASMVNRWALYRIAQYCDQMVPDGQGGEEPRFTCNLYLQKQADAWAVIQDLASIFHGLAFWDGSQITVNADMPQDSAYTYTLAQIISGNAVSYQGSKWRDRHSQAMVSFDDPAQGFETDKEPVFDDDAIAEYGVRELSVEVPGCTSRGQAQRAGNWALLTEQMQLRGTTIRVGLDGYIPKPGKVISLADPMLSGRANGGRIAAVAGRVVTVDRDIEVPTGARLLVNLPSGKSEARQVRSVTGRSVTVMADYSEVPEAECGWALDYDDLKLMQFYVRNVSRPEWHQFQLELIQHEPSKFPAIDYGTMIDDRPISVLPVGVQAAPARVLITSHSAVDQGIAVTTMTIGWDAAPGAVAYEVEWRWGSRDWVRVPRTGELAVDVRGVYAGQYLARVRAVSAMDVSSIPTTSMLTNVAGKTTPPPAVTHLATESLLFGIKVTWGFPVGAGDTERTELWYSEGTDLGAATKLADLAYPQNEHVMQGQRAGQRFFFWARLVDRSGNVGPFFPVAPTVVTGIASADASPILEQIKDQITESELGKELTSKIEKIALIDGNGPGSVNERVGAAKTELAKQISEVNNALGTVKGNLEQQITAVSADVSAAKTELQQQIANVSALAGSLPYRKDKAYSVGQSALGSDGKLYQALKAVPLNTPPPNATYWTDVGQAVVTANGMAARVSKVETDVSTLDGKVTAQASQISGLQAGLSTTNDNLAKKADASAVSSLGLRVSDAEGKLSSQATRMDGMQTSIDGKASSQALQQVTSRVTATEDKDKAQDQLISSQSQALTSLKDSVDKKADSSAVQSLSSEVKQQGQTLTSQGQSLVAINSTIGQLGGENWIYNPSFEKAGVGGLAAGWAADGASGTGITTTLVASTLAANEFAQRLQVTGVSASAWVRLRNPGDKQVQVTAGAPVTLSAYVKGTPGLTARCELQFLDSSNAAIGGTPTAVNSTLGADYQRISHSVTAPAGAVKVNYRITVYGTASITAGFVEVDRAQIELSANMSGWRDNGVVDAEAAAAAASAVQSLSGRVDQTESSLTSQSGAITQLSNSLNTTNQEVGKKADASTVQSLGNTVSQQGTTITANGRALTGISASLSNLGASGVNLVPAEYCAFAKDLPTNMYSNGGVAMSTVPDATAFKGYALKAANSNVDSHTFGLNTGFTAAGCNMGFKPGKYLVSFYARAEVAGHVVGAYARVLLADGSSFKTSNAPTFALTTAWARYVGVIDLTDPAYTGTQMQLAVQSNRSGVANRVTYYDRFMLEAAVNDQVEPSTFSMGNSFEQAAVLAEATSALSGRVGKTEEGLTSTSSQLTQLKNSIGGSGVNLVPSDYSQFRDPLPVIGRSANVSVSLINSSASPTGKALRVVSDAVASRVLQFSAGYTDLKLSLKADTAYIVSGWLSSGAATGKIQWFLWYYNESNTVTYLFGPDQDIMSTGQRLSAAITAPVEGLYGVGIRVNRAAVEGAAVVIDRVMVEQQVGSSAAPSTYVPGGTADQASAASSAIESLNSAVIQQGKDLTAVASRTTLLESSVNSASSGLATKASTSALQTLTGRVSATEGGLTAANSSITRIGSQIDAIGGAGSNLIPAEFTSFGPAAPSLYKLAAMQVTTEADSAAYSGYLLKANVSGSAATGFMYLASAIADYNLRLKPGASYTFSVWAKGSAAHVVGVRLRFINSSGSVTEAVVGTISVTTTLARQSVVITAPANLVSTCCLVLFTQNTAAVGTTWFDGFMLEAQVGASAEPSAFVPGPSNRQIAAQAIAVDVLDTKVTQQGTRIESEAKRTDGLYTSVGDANAAIQNEATARSSADTALGKRVDTVQSNLGSTNASVQQISTAQTGLNSKVNASYSVRLQVVNGNQYVAAGFGVGVENDGGVLQSTFAVMADRFAVLNPSGNGFVSPFAIQNGQVFLNEAFISTATIQRAIVGNSINSSELANNGVPIMRMDFASGTIIMQNKAASAYTVFNRSGIDMVINGIRRIRMGEW